MAHVDQCKNLVNELDGSHSAHRQWKKRYKSSIHLGPCPSIPSVHRQRSPLVLILTLIFISGCVDIALGLNCDDIKIGDLVVMDNPVSAKKIGSTKLTTLRILEEQYFGSLTCHVLRSRDQPLFDHFLANSSTIFKSANAYDPYIFGKKTHRIFTCDIFLIDDFFREKIVDLEIALILQPLLERNGRNRCDVPVIARQTITIEFDRGQGRGGVDLSLIQDREDTSSGSSRTSTPPKKATRYPWPFATSKPPTRAPDTNPGQDPFESDRTQGTSGSGSGSTINRPQRPTTPDRNPQWPSEDRDRDPQRPSQDRDREEDRDGNKVKDPDANENRNQDTDRNTDADKGPAQESSTDRSQKGGNTKQDEGERNRNPDNMSPEDEGLDQTQNTNDGNDGNEGNDTKETPIQGDGQHVNKDKHNPDESGANDNEETSKSNPNGIGDQDQTTERITLEDDKPIDPNNAGDNEANTTPTTSETGTTSIKNPSNDGVQANPTTSTDGPTIGTTSTTERQESNGGGTTNLDGDTNPDGTTESNEQDIDEETTTQAAQARPSITINKPPNDQDRDASTQNPDQPDDENTTSDDLTEPPNEEVSTVIATPGTEQIENELDPALSTISNEGPESFTPQPTSRSPNDEEFFTTTDGSFMQSTSKEKSDPENQHDHDHPYSDNSKPPGGSSDSSEDSGNKFGGTSNPNDSNGPISIDSNTPISSDSNNPNSDDSSKPSSDDQEDHDHPYSDNSKPPGGSSDSSEENGNTFGGTSKSDGSNTPSSNDSNNPNRNDSNNPNTDDSIKPNSDDSGSPNSNGSNNTNSDGSINPNFDDSSDPNSSGSNSPNSIDSKNPNSGGSNNSDSDGSDGDEATFSSPKAPGGNDITDVENDSEDGTPMSSNEVEGNGFTTDSPETATKNPSESSSTTVKEIEGGTMDSNDPNLLNDPSKSDDNASTEPSDESVSTDVGSNINNDNMNGIQSTTNVNDAEQDLVNDDDSQTTIAFTDKTTPIGPTTLATTMLTTSEATALTTITSRTTTMSTTPTTTAAKPTVTSTMSESLVTPTTPTASSTLLSQETLQTSTPPETTAFVSITVMETTPTTATMLTTITTAVNSATSKLFTTFPSVSDSENIFSDEGEGGKTSTQSSNTNLGDDVSNTVPNNEDSDDTSNISDGENGADSNSEVSSTFRTTTDPSSTKNDEDDNDSGKSGTTEDPNGVISPDRNTAIVDALSTERLDYPTTESPIIEGIEYEVPDLPTVDTDSDYDYVQPRPRPPFPSNSNPNGFGNGDRGRQTTRAPRIVRPPPGSSLDQSTPSPISESESILDNRILVDEPILGENQQNVTVSLPPVKKNDDEDNNVLISQRNASLFWSILAVVICLALVILGILVYYCCPGMCCCCGECALREKELKEGSGPQTSARNLTFVAVRDGNGRPLRDASSVQVWNTQRNDIKTYPVVNAHRHSNGFSGTSSLTGDTYLDFERRPQRRGQHLDPIPSSGQPSAVERYFSNSRGARFLRREGRRDQYPTEMYPPGDRRRFSDSESDPYNDRDDTVMVRERPQSSPVMVRILQALSPRGGRSMSANPDQRPDYARQTSRNRVFQIVRDEYERRRSGRERGDVQILALEHQNSYPGGDGSYSSGTNQKNHHHPGVQVLNLDGGRHAEMYRREGSAEILELDSNASEAGDEDEERSSDVDGVRINLEDYDELVQHRSVGIDDDGMTFEQHRHLGYPSVARNSDGRIVKKNVSSEDKMIQTENSYMQRKLSKKCQTIHLDESDSDDDQDLANQSLSQSMASSLQGLGYSKSFNDPGFLNVAMHTLVRDQMKNGTSPNLPLPPGAQGQQPQRNVRETIHSEDEDQFAQSHRSLLSYPGRSYSRHTHNSDPPDHQRFSTRKKSHNYYNGSRTPPTPNYTETKASILRRRTINARPPELKLSRKRTTNLNKYHSASLTDMSQSPRYPKARSLSRNTSTPEGLDSL